MVKTIAHGQSDGVPVWSSDQPRIFMKRNLVSMFQQRVVANQSTIREGGGKQGSSRKAQPKMRMSRRTRVENTSALSDLGCNPAMSSS